MSSGIVNNVDFKLSTHLSIAWGVMLAIITLVEWNSLGREPMKDQILSPFIHREITIYDATRSGPQRVKFEEAMQRSRASGASPRLEIEVLFNGPLFLVCFFAPIAGFRGLEWLIAKLFPSGN